MSSTNNELQLANDFVQYTGSNIFLTGKAGTGKITFLQNLHKNTAKRMIITAPTGVAAINAGGVTLHSFFQLPFGPFLPGSDTYERNKQRQFRFSKEKKHSPPAYTESDVAHPELFRTLKDWRSSKAKEEDVAHFQILHQRVLILIVVCLPDNTADLRKINGVGKKTIEKYGEELVQLVSAYRKKHGIKEVVLPDIKTPSGENITANKEASHSDTKQTSLDMFNKGLTVDRIAQERGLVQSTIEGHLAFFVEKGKLDINKLLSPEKQQAIEKELATDHNNSLKEVKNALGDDYSYGEIRMMLACRKHLESE